jgi:hypothetical protein
MERSLATQEVPAIEDFFSYVSIMHMEVAIFVAIELRIGSKLG